MLVFIFFGFLILFLLSIVLLLVFTMSTIKIKIKDLKIENSEINKKYKFYIELYFLNKIKIFSIKINNDKYKKIVKNKRLKNLNKSNLPIGRLILNIIKKIRIEKLNLKLSIGTEDVPFTSYVVAIIAGIIGANLPKYVSIKDTNKINYSIEPIYNKNTFNLYLDSIINLKIVHIIYIIYNLVKKGRGKNERTSNRRAYAYSHGFN